MKPILNAKYLGDIDNPSAITHIQLFHGNGEYSHIRINENLEIYKEIMRQVEAGELTIQPADS